MPVVLQQPQTLDERLQVIEDCFLPLAPSSLFQHWQLFTDPPESKAFESSYAPWPLRMWVIRTQQYEKAEKPAAAQAPMSRTKSAVVASTSALVGTAFLPEIAWIASPCKGRFHVDDIDRQLQLLQKC
jgi:hypothetical protein